MCVILKLMSNSTTLFNTFCSYKIKWKILLILDLWSWITKNTLSIFFVYCKILTSILIIFILIFIIVPHGIRSYTYLNNYQCKKVLTLFFISSYSGYFLAHKFNIIISYFKEINLLPNFAKDTSHLNFIIGYWRQVSKFLHTYCECNFIDFFIPFIFSRDA